MRWMAWVLAAVVSAGAGAQWTLQESHTTASLRGIHSVGNGVAWASGTAGTVLRTVDGGAHWQVCAVPPGAEDLDFRGVQGFDEKTAIVMSSGKGDLSRLYKTVDGCGTWKLVFVNPDREGFWDAVVLNRFDKDGELLGDPVNGRFSLWETGDRGDSWSRNDGPGQDALPGEGAFAASNSSLSVDEANSDRFVTGGSTGARMFVCGDNGNVGCHAKLVPLGNGTDGSGGFSIDYRDYRHWVAVGGSYRELKSRVGTAIHTFDEGRTWQAASKPPNGYRSAVAYLPTAKIWIAVGPNGTDVSRDDGRNWRALKPGSGEQTDADRNWNALSLPFVVGPKGRIGVLRADALRRP